MKSKVCDSPEARECFRAVFMRKALEKGWQNGCELDLQIIENKTQKKHQEYHIYFIKTPQLLTAFFYNESHQIKANLI